MPAATMTRIPLVLVPGLMCNHAVWEPLDPWLQKDRDCTVADHGHADALTEMAERLLQEAPSQMVLAGHSMGARVVLEAVRLAPQRIRGVALLDTGFHPAKPGEEGSRDTLLQLALREGMASLAARWLPPMLAQDRVNDDALMRRLSGEDGVMWGPSIIGFGRHHYRHDSGREGDMPAVAFSPRSAMWRSIASTTRCTPAKRMCRPVGSAGFAGSWCSSSTMMPVQVSRTLFSAVGSA